VVIDEKCLDVPVSVKLCNKAFQLLSASALFRISNGVFHDVLTNRHCGLHLCFDLVRRVPKGEGAAKRQSPKEREAN
jgi:hypothetical protein